jgi:ribokinase
VDTSHIVRSGVSGVCLALLDKSRDRSNIIFPNANDTLSLDQLDPDYILNTRYLYLSSFVGESPLKAQLELIKELPSRIKLSFDPGEIYARLGLEKLLPIIRKSHTIFITDEEIGMLTGKDYKDGAVFLRGLGPETVVCKMGASGCYVLSEQSEFRIPAPKKKVVDRTGAGDVFAAGFLAGELLGRSLYNSALFATEAASWSITEYGRARYPDTEFLRKKLR